MTSQAAMRGRWGWIRGAVVRLAVAALVIWALAVLWQQVLANRLLRAVLDAHGLRQVSARVLEAGCFSARVVQVRLGAAPDAPQMAEVELRYSPVSLLRRRLHQLRICNARVALDQTDDGAVRVADIDPGLLAMARNASTASAHPWRIGSLVADAGLELRAAGGDTPPITGTVSVTLNSTTGAISRVTLEAAIAGVPVRAVGHITRSDRLLGVYADVSASVQPQTAGYRLPASVRWLGDLLEVSGCVILQETANHAWDGRVTWRATGKRQLVLLPAATVNLPGVTATGCVTIVDSRPMQVSAEVVGNGLRVAGGGREATGCVGLRADATAPFESIRGTLTADCAGVADARLLWQVGLASGVTARVDGTLTIATTLLARAGGDLSVGGSPVVHATLAEHDGRCDVYAEAILPGFSGVAGGLSFGATGMVASVSAWRTGRESGLYAAELHGRGGWLSGDGSGRAAIDGLSLDLVHPGTDRMAWQRFEVGGVQLQPTEIAVAVSNDAVCVDLGLRATGSAGTAQVVARGSWRGTPCVEATIEVPEVWLETNDAVVAALTHRAGTDITVAGTVGGRAKVAWRLDQQPGFSGVWQVRDMIAASVARQWQVSGLSASVSLSGHGATDWRVAADDDTRFRSASLAGLTVTNGAFRWSASPAELFIERGGFGWCGGAVRLYAVHAALNNAQAECVLYIDQVDLGALLSQMRVLKGTGSGTLYGRLPLSLRGGDVRLSDGFLYSLPGQGGRLRVTDTAYLSQVLAEVDETAGVRARLVAALTDLDFSLFRMDLEPPDGVGDAVLRLRIAGQAHDRPGDPPVDLNVNIKGPLERLFNMGLKLR